MNSHHSYLREFNPILVDLHLLKRKLKGKHHGAFSMHCIGSYQLYYIILHQINLTSYSSFLEEFFCVLLPLLSYLRDMSDWYFISIFNAEALDFIIKKLNLHMLYLESNRFSENYLPCYTFL